MQFITRRAARRDAERGASLVEFALLLPLMMALILGAFTGGASYNRKISMTNAVREGARFGATLPDGSTWASDVVTRVQEVASGDLENTQICVQLVKAPSNVLRSSPTSPTPCPLSSNAPPNPTGVLADTCIVKVWAQRTSDLQVIFFSYDLDLKASAVARFERTCP